MSFSENFIKIMDAIGSKIGIAIDWTNKNVMPYMEQLCGRIVNYELYTSVAWLVFLTILFIIGVVLLVKGNKRKNDPNRPCYDEFYLFYMISGSILVGASILIGISEVGDIISCLTLPEKTIIEFIMKYK